MQMADEERAESRSTRLAERRSAQVSRTFEGTVDLHALFDPVSGEVFASELERLEKQLFENDWADARQRLGGEIESCDLRRTSAQRRCDALVLMARRSASSGNHHARRPLISVVVDKRTFGRVCELASGTVITPGSLVPLLGEAEIERIVYDGKSRVIDVGRRRLFTGALRRAIEVRDRHCQHESGCNVRADRCDVDDTVAFARGGNTDQANGRLLCPAHNRHKGAGPP